MAKMTADAHANWVAKNWNARLPEEKRDYRAGVEFDRGKKEVIICIQSIEVCRYFQRGDSKEIRPMVVTTDSKLIVVFENILKACKADLTTQLLEIPDFPWNAYQESLDKQNAY